jgi:ribosomal protein S18 acetylase RimI-like enzyme
MPHYIIRDCAPGDLPQLLILCLHHAEYEQATFHSAGKEESLKTALFSDHPKLFCRVVEVNDRLVGYVSYTIDFSTWSAAPFLYMDCLYLEDEYRSRGIGTEIFNQLKATAAEKNCVNIQWQTPVFNTRAIGFYHRMGGLQKEKSRFTLPVTI